MEGRERAIAKPRIQARLIVGVALGVLGIAVAPRAFTVVLSPDRLTCGRRRAVEGLGCLARFIGGCCKILKGQKVNLGLANEAKDAIETFNIPNKK